MANIFHHHRVVSNYKVAVQAPLLGFVRYYFYSSSYYSNVVDNNSFQKYCGVLYNFIIIVGTQLALFGRGMHTSAPPPFFYKFAYNIMILPLKVSTNHAHTILKLYCTQSLQCIQVLRVVPHYQHHSGKKTCPGSTWALVSNLHVEYRWQNIYHQASGD